MESEKVQWRYPGEYPFDLFDARGPRAEQPRLHRHDSLELNWVTAGHGINYIDGRKYFMSAGELYLINNLEDHIAVSDGSLRMKVLVFDPEFVWQNDPENADYLRPFYSGTAPAVGAGLPGVAPLFERLEAEWKRHAPDSRLFLRAYLLELLAQLGRQLGSEQTAGPSGGRERLRGVTAYISDHFEEPLTLAQLARVAAMSPNYFCTYFRKTIGLGVSEYVELVRINHACLLLQTTDRPVLEICLTSGFQSLSTFNAAFKRIAHCTPGVYRRRG